MRTEARVTSFKMSLLSFLSRDPKNSKRVAQLQLEASALNVTKKAKKQVAAKNLGGQAVLRDFPSLPVDVPVLPPKPSSASLEVNAIISEFMLLPKFSTIGLRNLCCDASSSEDHEIKIPPSVKLVMENLIAHVEMKCGKKNPCSKLKFMGRIKKPHLSWKQRADIIYFMLHPAFANKLTSKGSKLTSKGCTISTRIR